MANAVKTKINRQDLKIFPSERLTDNDDGGGMPLGTPLFGTPNELFNPIPSIERVNGSFHARLEYMGVMRADDEALIGAYAAITQPPKDPSVSYLLFPATRFGESRAEILKRIEAYNVGTIESRMTLMSTQSQNSRIIQAYQRVGEPLPLVGDVYCLRQNKAGYPLAEQYIQVTAVKSEDRTFTSPQQNKDFIRTVIQMEISAKLKTDFIGVEYPAEGYGDAPCKIRETAVADAAQYYGVKPLALAIAKEVSKIQITSLMEKIVPTNQVSTPLVDLTAAGQTQTLFDGSMSGNGGLVTLAINKNHTLGSISSIYFGNAVTPSSVTITNGNAPISDKGGMLYSSGSVIGSIDYANGFATITEPTFSGYLGNGNFRPAGSQLKVADTTRISVDINNRSANYVINLEPAPAVGTLQVSYRSQGTWYTLTDDGSGVLRGASAQYGSGSVNFITGSANISLSELPDVGSSVLWAWGTRANYFNRGGTVIVPQIGFMLATNQAVVATTLGLSLVDKNNATVTANTDRFGNITGVLEGKFDRTTRQILITKVNAELDGNPTVTATYVTANASSNTVFDKIIHNSALTGTKVSFDFGDFAKGMWSFSWDSVDTTGARVGTHTYADDGQGNLINEQNQVVGTVDYANHTASFDSAMPMTYQQAVYKTVAYGDSTRNVLTGYETVTNPTHIAPTMQSLPNATVTDELFVLHSEAMQGDSKTEDLIASSFEIDLLPNFEEVITPSSVNLTFGGKTYFDKAGSIYTDLDPKTGSANRVGAVNYQTGKMTLTEWNWGNLGSANGSANGSAVITSLVTSIDGNPVDAVTFRTPASPLRPASITLRATATDGTLVTATSDYSGKVSGAWATGTADYQYGVGDVKFGKLVTVTDEVKKQSWYSADNVKDGKIWQPLHVFADTITYNADAYAYLPIDSGVVKIDTVRLPQDGRVPIFRRGDTVLISNRQVDNIGSAFVGGQTINLSRKDVDRICVTDSDGKPVLAIWWDYDLDNGTITWASPLDLSAYKLPLSVTHVQEERNRILQADIDGTLSLIFPTKRAYPLAGTYVSSVLIGGDLQVRVSVPFTQKAWKNIWQDTPDGDQLLNKLNLKDYPMLLTDDGAITDRWMIKWVSGSQFQLYSEALGFVGKYDLLTDLAPINPATGKPYFIIPKQAFGNLAPWGEQDVIRFNTWGTLMPVWVLCAAQPTTVIPEGEDGFVQCLFGDTTEI